MSKTPRGIQAAYEAIEKADKEAQATKMSGKFLVEITYQEGVLQRVNDTRTRYGLSAVAG
jgi:hypothetical protein